MSSYPRGRRKAGKGFDPKVRALAKEKLGLKGNGPYVFIEGFDSYAEEYKKYTTHINREHPSLLKIIECDDRVFYDLSSDEQLRYFHLDHFKRVIFDLVDDIDFSTDDRTSPSGTVNELNPRREGFSVTGHTTIVEYQGRKRSLVLMRRNTGRNAGKMEGDAVDPRDVVAGTKMAALIHEIGHVDDFEKSINYRESQLCLVDAEAYAHHFACKTMIERNYLLVLGFYLEGLQAMANSQSMYIQQAATRVLESSECGAYQETLANYRDRLAHLDD